MSTIKDTATVELFVNGEQASQTIDRLKKQTETLKTAIKEAQDAGDSKKVNKLQRELDKVTKELNRTESASKGVGIVLNNLSNSSIHGLQNALKYLQKELRLTKPDTEAWGRYKRQIEDVKNRIAELNDELAGSESLWDRFKSWAEDSWPAIDLAVRGYQYIVSSLREYVDTYAAMDQEMANVRKFTGMTEKQVAELNEEFKKIDTRTSREELNKLAQEAGRLGKSSVEDVLGFVRAADKINVALDDLGQGATLTLSKLAGIFGVEDVYGTEQSLLKIGSVINELSQNCSAAAPYISNFTERLGGVGAQANLTIPQIMGFGAVLDSNAQKVEASATALSQIIVRLYQEPAKYAKVAGLEVESFTKLMREDANSALILFLETLQKAGGMDALSPMFKDMGENGSRAISALSTLATHIEKVKRQQEAANIAFEEGTSIDTEFAVQNNTVAAALEKCRNRANELRVVLGEQIQPLMRHIFVSSSAMIKAVLTLILFGKEHATSIGTLAVATTSYIAICKLQALWLDRLAVKEALLKKSSLALSVAQKVLTGTMAVMRLGFVSLENAVAYFRNGLNVTYTMQERWRKSMDAMKFSTWAGLILAVASAVYLLYNRMKTLTGVQKAMADAEKQANDEIAETVTKIKTLQSIIEDEQRSLWERHQAITALRAIMDDYNGTLDEEGRLIEHNTGLIDAYIKKLRERALAAALEEQMKQAYQDLVTSGLEIVKNKNDDNFGSNRLASGNADSFKADLLSGNISAGMKMNESVAQGTGTHTYAPAGYGGLSITGYNIAGFDTSDQKTVDRFNNALEIFLTLSKQVDSNYLSSIANKETGPKVNQERYETDEAYKTAVDELKATLEAAISAAGSDQHKKDVAQYQYQLGLNDLNGKQGIVGTELDSLDSPYMSDAEKKKAEKERKKMEAEERRALAKEKKEFKAQLDAYKAQRSSADLEVLELYKAGSINYQDFLRQLHENELNYYDSSIKHFEKVFAEQKETFLQDDKDYQKLLLNREKSDEKYEHSRIALALDSINRRKAAEEKNAQHMFDVKTGPTVQDEIALQSELYRIRMSALIETQALYAVGSKEYADVKYQIEALELEKELALKKTHFNAVNVLRKEYDKKSSAEKFQLEKATLDALLKANILTAEQYANYLKALAGKYKQELPGESKKSWSNSNQKKYDEDTKALKDALNSQLLTQAEFNERMANLDRERREKILDGLKKNSGEWNSMLVDVYTSFANLLDGFDGSLSGTLQNIADCTAAVSSVVVGAMQVATEFAKAEAEIQIRSIEKRYEREIELAQGNSYKVAKAEKKKEQEIQKVKAEASRKEFALKVFMAIAQTAQNALMAYAAGLSFPFPANTVMPAVLAGVAAAQGAVQVALLRKQQQAAEAQGYSKGGFTKPGAVDEPAGIVHAGEWVASQKLLANPVARPMIEALDYAQRTNTIGTLRAEDVSRSIRANDSLVRISESDNASALMVAAVARMSRSIENLNDRLNEPFVTINTVTGDYGIKQAQDEYSRLIDNVTPKSKLKKSK